MHNFYVICACIAFVLPHLTAAVVIKRSSSVAENDSDFAPNVTLFQPIIAETEKPLRLRPVPTQIFEPTVHLDGSRENSFKEQSTSNAQIKRKPENGGEATYECFVSNVNLGEIKSFDEYYQKHCPKNANKNLANTNAASQASQAPPTGNAVIPYYQPYPNPNWNGNPFGGIPNPAAQYPYPTAGFNPYAQNIDTYNSHLAQAIYRNGQLSYGYAAPVSQQFGYAPQTGVPYPYYTGR